VNATPIGRVEENEIVMLTQDYRKRDRSRALMLRPDFEEKVALIKFYPGMDPAIIQLYTEKNYRGLVIEGTGLGHISKACYEALRAAVGKGIIVGMTSQCIWGRINMNVYDAGRDLQALGVIPLEDMLPETALVKLMWVLGQTENNEEAKKLLKTNVAGEFSPRTLAEKMTFE
jgi:glutamyl-tRNA(Gln) amidotransferase subunit D